MSRRLSRIGSEKQEVPLEIIGAEKKLEKRALPKREGN